MNKQQIKQILEEEADLDKAVEQILALGKTEKSKVESTVITNNKLEYEIVSFKDKHSNRIMTRTDHKETIFQYNKPNIHTFQFYSSGWYLTEHYLLKNPNWIIHSVKRLSDGEVFTIGDICNPKGYQEGKNSYPINRFEIIQDEFLRISSENWYLNISSLQKVETKTPLFKTEDGVDIFEGDTFYFTRKSCSPSTVQERIADSTQHHSKPHEYFCDFSTKQAAEEYIILNKPCLSAKEVLTYINKNRPKVEAINEAYTKISNFPELQKLVKSKLN